MHIPLSVVVRLGLVNGKTAINKMGFLCLGLVNPQKVFVFYASVNYSFLLLGLMVPSNGAPCNGA